MIEEKQAKTEDKKEKCCPPKNWHHHDHGGGAGGAIYFFGLIGVSVYYIQQVSGFWPIVLAILKAIVWPAFLLYKVFTMLHM
jgi:hypothetical protein